MDKDILKEKDQVEEFHGQKQKKKESLEERIQILLDFMQGCLKETPPNFRDFWQYKKDCLLLFKENTPLKRRKALWQQYVEISNGSRQLKEVVEEESAFAREQIELAISALERDLENQPLLLQQMAEQFHLIPCHTLSDKLNFYIAKQKEVDLYHIFAARIHSLKDEILKREMRLKLKHLLFAKLMKLGDLVFPMRKEFILQLSNEFMEQINGFVHQFFDNPPSMPIQYFKSEIQALQAWAKNLTLSFPISNEVRKKLCECWDHLKEKEANYRVQLAEKKEVQATNFEKIAPKVEAFIEKCKVISSEEMEQESKNILEEMRREKLSKEGFKALKTELMQAKDAFYQKINDEKEERRRIEEKEAKEMEEKIVQLKSEISFLLESNQTAWGDLKEKYLSICQKREQYFFSNHEQVAFNILLKQLNHHVSTCHQKELFAMQNKDQNLDELYDLLEERKKQRLEVKKDLEICRKASGGSSLDFDRAMFYSEMTKAAKILAEEIENALIEVEEKIFDLEESKK
ncbi:MAG: hypothetical protein L0207_02280 [Chlamydiae bacterium]|nr:hypothetical protein [Chlamydiota bacterium]